MSNFFNKCLVPSYHNFSEDVRLKKVFMSHCMDTLLIFLNSILTSAKNGDFNTNTIKTTVIDLIRALNSQRHPRKATAQVDSKVLFKLFKDAAGKLEKIAPPLQFSRNLLTLLTRLVYKKELGKQDQEAVEGAANFTRDYLIQFINGQTIDKRYKEIIEIWA